MPGCHPGLLFQVFPAGIPWVYRPLLPFDPNCVVTGNLVFIFGTFKKPTLQRREGKQARYLVGGSGYLKMLRESKAV